MEIIEEMKKIKVILLGRLKTKTINEQYYLYYFGVQPKNGAKNEVEMIIKEESCTTSKRHSKRKQTRCLRI